MLRVPLCRGFLHQRNLNVQGFLHPGHSYPRDVILTSRDSYLRVFLRRGFLHPGILTSRDSYIQGFVRSGVITFRGS